MKNKEFSFFTVVSLLHLSGELLENPATTMITKPLIMASLIIYYRNSTTRTPLDKFVVPALVFSLIGDSLLLFQKDNSLFFLGGLGVFLLAHLVYSFLNFNLVNDDQRKIKLYWQDLPIIALGFIVFLLIKEGVGNLQIPVLCYIVVISIMGISARQRWKRADRQSFWLIMSGALSFMLSDSLLAINKFTQPIDNSGFWIMLTYILAQFLIVRGLIVFIQKIRPEAGS